MHLDVAANSRTINAIAPVSVTDPVESDPMEIRHFRTALFTVLAGAGAGDVTFDVLEADTAGGTYTQVSGLQTVKAGLAPGSKTLFQLDASTRKPFVKVSVEASSDTVLAVSALLWRPSDTRFQLDETDVPEVWKLN